jgi:hypothetical protein
MRLRHILAALAILFAPLAAQPALAQLRVTRGDEQPSRPSAGTRAPRSPR